MLNCACASTERSERYCSAARIWSNNAVAMAPLSCASCVLICSSSDTVLLTRRSAAMPETAMTTIPKTSVPSPTMTRSRSVLNRPYHFIDRPPLLDDHRR